MIAQLRPAFVMLVIMTLVTGAIYPLVVTGVAQVAMPRQANGSLIERSGKPAGSDLIGQTFSDSKYFWSRPSGTAPFPYNAGSSSGTNLGPTNPALAEAVAGRIKALGEADPANTAAVPVDLVTASGSGLDPQKVRALIAESTEGRQLGFLGEPRVNVLKLNLALDPVAAKKRRNLSARHPPQ